MSHLAAILQPFAALFFQRRPLAGAAVLALLLLQPAAAGLALLAVLASAGFLRALGRRPGEEAGVLANAALLGLAVRACGTSAGAAIGLAVLAALLVVPLTLVLDAPLRRLGAGALSLPFTMIAWALLLALRPAPAVHAASWDSGWLWADAFLRGFGALLWRGDVATGAVLALLVLIHSRVLLATAAAGFLAACLTRCLWTGSWAAACGGPADFNATLAGMAVGAVLLVPGPRALLAALLAGAGSALITQALAGPLAGLGLPVFTAPFVLVCVLAVRAAARLAPDLLPVVVEDTPEATLAHHAALARRLEGQGWDIALPVAGRWSVWQGEDGPWTHQGAWRHAIDLVARDDEGHLHRGSGRELADWHAFGRPVLAPVDGSVVAVVDGIADNPVGRIDSQRNWGNLVIIADPRGFHVELSHLRCGSLRVALGQWVVRGQVLGEVGNSGCSPQPHLHVQAQAGGRVGDPTIPFRFGVQRRDGALRLDGLPAAGCAIETVPADAGLAQALDLVPGAVLRFRAGCGCGTDSLVALRVGRALDGCLTLETGRGRLVLGRHAGSLRVWRREGDDPWLALLQRALPSLPLCRLDGLAWHDHLPATMARPGWRGQALAFAGLLRPELAAVRVALAAVGGDRVLSAGEAGTCCVTLDDQQGLVAVRGGAWWLRRCSDPSPADALSLASWTPEPPACARSSA